MRSLGSILWLSALVLSCHGPAHHDLTEKIHHDESPEPVVVAGVEYFLDGLRYAPYPEGDFFVRTRTDQLTQTPCSRCHAEEALGVAAGALPERAHRQILRPHGAANGVVCTTCHDAASPDQLVGLRGPVPIDQVYDSCATCHFEQRRDWQVGGHGKRLATWSGPRVIENCTGCHDPHAPAFEVRLPTTMYPGVEGGRAK